MMITAFTQARLQTHTHACVHRHTRSIIFSEPLLHQTQSHNHSNYRMYCIYFVCALTVDARHPLLIEYAFYGKARIDWCVVAAVCLQHSRSINDAFHFKLILQLQPTSNVRAVLPCSVVANSHIPSVSVL